MFLNGRKLKSITMINKSVLFSVCPSSLNECLGITHDKPQMQNITNGKLLAIPLSLSLSHIHTFFYKAKCLAKCVFLLSSAHKPYQTSLLRLEKCFQCATDNHHVLNHQKKAHKKPQKTHFYAICALGLDSNYFSWHKVEHYALL